MDRRRFLEAGSTTLLSRFVLSSGRGEVSKADKDEREAYVSYVESSSEFESIGSTTGVDWIVVEQIDSASRAIRVELLRLDRPEWRQATTVSLDACPMISVTGPARYEASASFSPRSGKVMEFRFDEPVQVRIYRASQGFREVVVVAG